VSSADVSDTVEGDNKGAKNMAHPARLFLHYLGRLKNLLLQIDACDPDISGNRLHPDMFPLWQQATTAIGFTLRASCPLAGREIASFRTESATVRGALVELDATMAYLAAIPEADFDAVDAMQVQSAAGFAHLELPAADYYTLYAMPNFFFHYAMVYAIARQAGLPIGKADFDGFHTYPPGFTFTNECDAAGS
jgi:hypothetical protein